MSAPEVQPPIYLVRCDKPGCNAQHFPARSFDRRSSHLARGSAGRDGWLVRPNQGKGSRTGPDLCPSHRPAAVAQ